MIVPQLVVKHMCLCVNINMYINRLEEAGGVVKEEDNQKKEQNYPLASRRKERHLTSINCSMFVFGVILINLHINPM